MPRWGKVGKQKIEDEGPLRAVQEHDGRSPELAAKAPKAKYDMETFDEVLVKDSCEFMDKAKKDGKPFFLWHNTTRMHVLTFLSPKYQAEMNAKTNYGLEEAGMKDLDDMRRRPAEAPGRHRRGRQHHRHLQHRQRRRDVHLAGRRQHAVQGHQGHGHRGRLPRAVHRPLAGPHQAGHGRRTASSPAWTGSPPSWPPPATPTSPSSFSRE